MRETRGHLLNGGLPARRGLWTAPGTVPTAQTRSGLGSGLRPSAAWSLNPLGIFNSPPIKSAPPATPPSHLRARRPPDLAARKTAAPYAAPEAAAAEGADRLRRSPFSRPLGRARSTALKGRRVLRSTALETARNLQKTALKPSFPHFGQILSIVWKTCEKFFHCVEKMALFFHSVENIFP